MKKYSDKEAFYSGFSLVATGLEYCLIFAPMLLGASNEVNSLIMALLSVFVMSLSGLVFLFSGSRIEKLCGISWLFRVLTFLSVVTTMLAVICSFALIVLGGSNSDSLVGIWHTGVLVLCILLLPRALLELAVFIYKLRRVMPVDKKSPVKTGQFGLDEGDLKRDDGAYERLWIKVIKPKMDMLCEQGGVRARPTAKEDIWRAYCEFNVLASECYTSNPSHRLDRHKVAACYMCAILKAMPLSIGDMAALGDREHALSNERLAITVGSSVLSSFLLQIIERLPTLNDSQKEAAKAEVKAGVKFPKVGHGTYRDNMLDCLCSMQVEGSYNLPLMFIVLFHWESLILTTEEYHSAVIDYYAERSRSTEPRVDASGEQEPVTAGQDER